MLRRCKGKWQSSAAADVVVGGGDDETAVTIVTAEHVGVPVTDDGGLAGQPLLITWPLIVSLAHLLKLNLQPNTYNHLPTPIVMKRF